MALLCNYNYVVVSGLKLVGMPRVPCAYACVIASVRQCFAIGANNRDAAIGATFAPCLVPLGAWHEVKGEVMPVNEAPVVEMPIGM